MIHKYFDSICRIVIAELSDLAEHQDTHSAGTADDLTELDIVHRLGIPFGHLARYRTIGSDLLIPRLGLELEVKYLRPFNNRRNSSVGMEWKKHVQKDFDHLFEAIVSGRKGQFGFVMCWPRSVPWRSLVQIGGSRRGQRPPVAPEKLALLPFLHYDRAGSTSTVYVRYSPEEGVAEANTKYGSVPLNWQLYGSSEDLLNMSLMW